jgi:DNA gyrase subunit A
MGRATSGVIGMRFRRGDSLLSMDVVRPDTFVVTVTDGGFAKRTPVSDWAAKGRGGLGVRAMKLVEERGSLVGGLVCSADDEIYAVGSNGVVIRTRVEEIRASGRDTMGVKLMDVAGGDTVVAVARAEHEDEVDDEAEDGTDPVPSPDGTAAEAVADAPETVAAAESAGDSGHNGPDHTGPDEA